jgi:hypothetical protein
MQTNIQRILSSMSGMMCLIAMSCQINFQSTFGVDGPGHHVHQIWIPVIILFRAASKIMCTAPTHALYRVASGNWSCWWKRSQATCCMMKLTTLWFIYSESTMLKGCILDMYSHEDHMHTKSPFKWPFIEVTCFCTLENYEYTIHQNYCAFLNTL